MGAGFGVWKVRRILDDKTGLRPSKTCMQLQISHTQCRVLMRGCAKPSKKGGGLGLRDFAAVDRLAMSCGGKEWAELDAETDLRYRLTVQTLSRVSGGEGGHACAEAGACAGVRGCAGASRICHWRGP